VARHVVLLSFDEDAVAEAVRGRQGVAEQMRGFERDRVDHVYPRLSTLSRPQSARAGEHPTACGGGFGATTSPISG
jgi:hypothetical protein